MRNNIVLIRSGGDIGTAVARMLHNSGFKVLILEINRPLAIRRQVAFSEAIFDGEMCVEGVKCKKVDNLIDINKCWQSDIIPIMIDDKCKILGEIKVDVLVDAILAKRNINTSMEMASYTIGLGPGFTAGQDVHAVIETQRGHDLGRIIYNGSAEKDTGIPGMIQGYAEERILRATCNGTVKVIKDIGQIVKAGEIILYVEKSPVKSKIEGVVRGCIRSGTIVENGLKIGDVDPRGTLKNCSTISDKARCIAGGVLEAILNFRNIGNEEI